MAPTSFPVGCHLDFSLAIHTFFTLFGVPGLRILFLRPSNGPKVLLFDVLIGRCLRLPRRFFESVGGAHIAHRSVLSVLPARLRACCLSLRLANWWPVCLFFARCCLCIRVTSLTSFRGTLPEHLIIIPTGPLWGASATWRW